MENKGTAFNPITAEDIVKKMRMGIKAEHEIDFRGVKIPVRVLSQDEFSDIRRAALMHAVKYDNDEVEKNVFTQKMVLIKSAQTSTKEAPILSEKVLSLLTTDEIGFLYNEYVSVLEMYNPSIEAIDPEKFKFIVDALKKNSLSAKDLSIHQLRATCIAYVDLLERYDSMVQKLNLATSQPVN